MKGTAYLLQATLIALWWIGLLVSQPFYEAFQFPGIGRMIGAILWQLVVRPIEEKDMQQRFGKEYEAYRKEVRCWIPKFKM